MVDILGSIDDKIELLTTENEKIEKYSNYLFDVFSENAIHKIKLKDVVCFANTGADAIQKAPIVDYDTGIRCARVGDFSNDRPIYEWGFCNIVPELFSQYQLKQNDILITRTATLGLAKLIDKDEQAVYNNGLIRIKINNKIACSKYIYRVLKSKDFIDYIAGIEGASSTRPNMKINYLLEYKFNILSMAEQLEFNACYSVLRNKQLHNQNSIFKLNELKQLYLKKFFG